VPEGAKNLVQRMQEQTARSILDFYGGSIGNLKGWVQGDRSKLESLAEQLPRGEPQARIQEMIESYSAMEGLLERAAGQVARGAQETVDQTVSREGREDGQSFEDVETFCMFIGYPRSGHSLVGSLLDAHPNVVIAHELNVLECVEKSFERGRILQLVLENSRRVAKSGREWEGYSYKVPNQWQGRFERLQVIGDKKGGASTRILSSSPGLLCRLLDIIDTDVKFIHVVRNPYDNISTMLKHRRRNQSLRSVIESYLSLCATNSKIRERVGRDRVFDLRHEALVEAPEELLGDLCGFLGLERKEDYLEDCASLVFDSPRKTRYGVEWDVGMIAAVQEGIGRHEFLRGYSYEE
jgi:Sulfotransferase family